jgi:hypothetical protein
MKIKQTVLAFALLIGMGSFFVSPIVSASATNKCGTVKTSIIDCDQTGLCAGGEDPYEGSDPKGTASGNGRSCT